MAGVYKITISESKAELKKLLITQKTGVNKERIQPLYLLMAASKKRIEMETAT
jgi:hypothetical protein